MLGWHISVYRQAPPSDEPASFAAVEGPRIAVWQAGIRGLEWLDTLVKNGMAIKLGGNGYPDRYSARASAILPKVLPEPPQANRVWQKDDWDVVNEKWAGRTVIDHTIADSCSPDEWLLIEVWDES